MKSAGISTDMISQIASSGKGGWFMRVSKRQYPTFRHGENQGIFATFSYNLESPLRTSSCLSHPSSDEMEQEIEKYISKKTQRESRLRNTPNVLRYKSKTKSKVKPLLLITKPFSPEASKMFNYKTSSNKKRDLLNRLREVIMHSFPKLMCI